MDSVTEKFSVFDFFNLIIGGSVFWMGLGLCHYSQTIECCDWIFGWLGGLPDSSGIVLLVATVLLVGCFFVTGSVVNEIAYWWYHVRKDREKDKMNTCLKKNELVTNEAKLNIFRKKAREYFGLPEFGDDQDFTPDQCAAYFAYCIYYLHVRGVDKKTEKLRETQGLSELMTLVFALIPILSLIIHLVLNTYEKIDKYILVAYGLCVICVAAFSVRATRAMENRIRMALAVYDACVDMDEQAK